MPSAFAPGRLELIGNHTDYNEGLVLAFAIDLGITMRGEPRRDSTVILRSREFGEDAFTLDAMERNPQAPWSDYVKGVLLQMKAAAAPLGGFEAEIQSTLPSGAGMSSSAAIEVAAVLLVQKLFDFDFGDMQDPSTRMGLARLCRAAENEFVGVQCGILDQATCLLGRKDHAVFLDCRSQETEALPLHPDFCFVVCHTGANHTLLSSKYNARRGECAEAVRLLQYNKAPINALRDISPEELQRKAGIFAPRIFQRAMHVAGENERVLAAKDAMLRHDMEKLGQLLYESHESSRDAFENSTPHLDQLVEIARELPGCVGARLTGGGFGGATLSMVHREQAAAFMEELQSRYRRRSGKEPQAWIVQASDGAA